MRVAGEEYDLLPSNLNAYAAAVVSKFALRLQSVCIMCERRERFCPQAEKLDEMLQHRGAGIDKVLSFEVPDSVLVSNRRTSSAVLDVALQCGYGLPCLRMNRARISRPTA